MLSGDMGLYNPLPTLVPGVPPISYFGITSAAEDRRPVQYRMLSLAAENKEKNARPLRSRTITTAGAILKSHPSTALHNCPFHYCARSPSAPDTSYFYGYPPYTHPPWRRYRNNSALSLSLSLSHARLRPICSTDIAYTRRIIKM